MKNSIIALVITFLSMNIQANTDFWPENLNEQYESLYHVPFLAGGNRFTKLEASDFTKTQYAILPEGKGIVYYESQFLSNDPNCNEYDHYTISLYVYRKEVLFAVASRIYACE